MNISFLQFVKIGGHDIPWAEYEVEVMKRFGAVYEDPLEEPETTRHC